MFNQNTRVIARRLNVTLNEKYTEVLMGKVFSKDVEFAETRTGGMIIVISNYFFNKGMKGSECYKMGRIAGLAFNSLNHGKESNIYSALLAVDENITESEKVELGKLLSDYISARTTEKSKPSIGNVIAKAIKNQHKCL